MAAPSSDSAGIRQVVRALKAGGWHAARVHDGGEWIPVKTEQQVIDAVMAVDDATLVVRAEASGGRALAESGWVRFVMGNEPEEVVCDHTINLSPVIDPLTSGWWS